VNGLTPTLSEERVRLKGNDGSTATRCRLSKGQLSSCSSRMNGEKLIVFIKAPRPGAVKTRLARTLGAEPACAAYRRIVATLLAQLRSLGAVELCFDPDDALAEIQPWLLPAWTAAPQGGGDLGQRLQFAFQRAFAAGSRRVLVIGSDCPAVTLADLREAWDCLRARDVALGRATDGGYWLIGLREAQPDLFRDIPWSTENVFAETLQRIRRGGLTVQVLRELSDVDTEADWRAFLATQNRNATTL